MSKGGIGGGKTQLWKMHSLTFYFPRENYGWLIQ